MQNCQYTHEKNTKIFPQSHLPPRFPQSWLQFCKDGFWKTGFNSDSHTTPGNSLPVRHTPWKTPVCLRTDIPGITDLLLSGPVTNLACEQMSANHRLQPSPPDEHLRADLDEQGPLHRQREWGPPGRRGQRAGVTGLWGASLGRWKVLEMGGVGWLDDNVNASDAPKPYT